MKFPVSYGCPNCGRKLIRKISPEKYEKLTGEKFTGTSAFMCPDAATFGDKYHGCGHVWCEDTKAKMQMDKKRESVHA